MHYWHEKDTGVKLADGEFITAAKQLVLMPSHGGITPLMHAAEAASQNSVEFLLEIGANPLDVDNYGRNARMYAMKSKENYEIAAML